MNFEDKIKDLNLTLPKAADPVGSYLATKVAGKILFISGQISMSENGDLIKGKLGKELNTEEGYKAAKNLLRDATGQKFWRNLEIAIRHKEATSSDHPVLAKLWYFWTNHFTISDKDMLSYYSTGAYQRESIRENLNKTFEELTYEATVAWAMILHLDNSENVGPKSEDARADWRKRKKRPATINENHARELLELHTVSPNSGYTQENIQELALIMTGWFKYHLDPK